MAKMPLSVFSESNGTRLEPIFPMVLEVKELKTDRPRTDWISIDFAII